MGNSPTIPPLIPLEFSLYVGGRCGEILRSIGVATAVVVGQLRVKICLIRSLIFLVIILRMNWLKSSR